MLHSHQISPNYHCIFFHSKTELRTDSGSLTLPHKSLQHLVQCCRHKRYSSKSYWWWWLMVLWRLHVNYQLKKARPGLSILIHSLPESRLIWVKVISKNIIKLWAAIMSFWKHKIWGLCFMQKTDFKSNYSYFIMWTIYLQFGKSKLYWRIVASR